MRTMLLFLFGAVMAALTTGLLTGACFLVFPILGVQPDVGAAVFIAAAAFGSSPKREKVTDDLQTAFNGGGVVLRVAQIYALIWLIGWFGFPVWTDNA